ncbi:GNAT family N-acetyltransferase [Vreelandella piezotolerans]|uniref:GNAT family N-acetyltransferase n=1 Tax=Vreelandella piezotolerans TaxID=2609667 RepID=A0ABQ6XA87_9GAMM|nr:GNAT family N-acetyltransferase [Halomonas piezotolerans]KAE8438917.1 GNAT family N-acetyltransferase [Halomonas piezotolerans]QJA25288.1 GNAT family N-acetyltransferase [Halomonas piezotolerans]
MLTKLKQLFSAQPSPKRPARHGGKRSRPLEEARPEDIDRFIEAVYQADAKGHSPWLLRDDSALETLRRALEFTVHQGLWLQREEGQVARWQGRLLALRHGEGPPLGMVLACRPDDEAAWQLRFFYISKEWKGSGHGTRLLRAVRRSLSGVPLQIRLPLTCYSAVDSLEAAGFTRQYVDAFEVATYEAPAKWDE